MTQPPHLLDRLITLGNYNVWTYYLPPSWLRAMALLLWGRWLFATIGL